MTMEMEAAGMGQYKKAALALTMMVRRLAARSGSELERFHHEWLLVPDDWLKVKFVAPGSYLGGVRISVGLPDTMLPPGDAHRIKMKRWPGWSAFLFQHESDLPAAQELLDWAFYHADSDYRARHGKPVALAGLGSDCLVAGDWQI
jgi:hypothetical protein